MSTASLTVDQIHKAFATRGEPLRVLRGCSLTLDQGSQVAILGPSGSGKSTLLQIIGTLDVPSSGKITLAGQDPFALDEPRLADFRNERIGFVFQDHYLLPQCSALENVLLPCVARGSATAADLQRAEELLLRVGLADRREHRPAELSGGERQRVAIARALIRQPLLLLADEPTGNLDRATAQGVADLLFELQQAERTMMIVVTHSQELAQRCARQFEMIDGQLQAR